MNNINVNDDMVMKLLHFFITKAGYIPIILHGVTDEIWLENMNSDYKIVRIASKYIHNTEQFERDLFKTEKIMGKIKRKTFSLKMRMANIYLNLGDNVELEDIKNIDSAYIKKEDDFKKYSNILNEFPNIYNEIKFEEKGIKLFSKITSEIGMKNKEESEKVRNIFVPKTPIVTYILIGLCVLMFLVTTFLGYGSTDASTLIFYGAFYKPYILDGEWYRLLTSAFLHIGIIHLLVNMYSLYVIGPHIENYYGKLKYVFIYLFSAIFGGLLSMIFVGDTISAGASGAIFGLLGAFLYFGYHYRNVLGDVLRRQIVPIILINLAIGFSISGINNAAHVGGLIGGVIISAILGVKGKTSKFERINAIIAGIILTGFIVYMGFFK